MQQPRSSCRRFCFIISIQAVAVTSSSSLLLMAARLLRAVILYLLQGCDAIPRGLRCDSTQDWSVARDFVACVCGEWTFSVA